MTGFIIFCCIAAWLIWWLAGETARESRMVKSDWPYHLVYKEIMIQCCKNLTLFGKIIVGGVLSILLLPGIVILPVMHFLYDVFKAAMFK